MIQNKNHILYSIYTILLLCTTGYTDTSFRNISAHVGDNVTLPDVPTKSTPLKGEWFYFKSGCSSHKHSDNGYCKLCYVIYIMEHIITYQPPERHKPLRYTCNKTGLHLYDVSTHTPSLYKLIHEYDSEDTTSHYFLNITYVKPTTPTKCTETTTYITTHTAPTLHSTEPAPIASNASFGALQSSVHSRPIIVTVIIATSLATFSLYMYYQYTHRSML